MGDKDQLRVRVGIVLGCVVVLVLYIVLFPHHSEEVHNTAASSNQRAATTSVFGEGASAGNHAQQRGVSAPNAAPRAIVRTNFGDIIFGLHPDVAPKTVSNFILNAREGVYNRSCFYRYETNFVLQGGLHCAGNMRSSPRFVPLEYSKPNSRLTVGLARSTSLDSGSTEFFINLSDNGRMLSNQASHGGYAVFASVTGGEDTISKLIKLPTKHEGLTMFVEPQPQILSIDIVA